MDMRMHWIRDRIQQGQFKVYWKPGQQNLADYPTKHHSGSHHKKVRPIYLHEGDTSPSTVQGCIEIMEEAHRKTIARPTCATSETSLRTHTGHGREKTVTWWDSPKTNRYAPWTKSYLTHRNKTKPCIANRPKYTRAMPWADHNLGTKTKTIMEMLQSAKTTTAPTRKLQELDKKSPTYTVKSSRNGVHETIKRLSFLV